MDQLVWGKLVLLDVQALLGILFWEGTASSLIILALWKYSTYLADRKLVEFAIGTRLVCAVGYLLFLYRGVLPDVLSSTIANIMIFTGFFIENLVSLNMIKMCGRREKIVSTVLWAGSCTAYILLDLCFGTSNSRVALASVAIFLIYLPITYKSLFTKGSSALNRILGVTYLLVMISAVPRFFTAVWDQGFSIHTTDIYQTALFVGLLVKSFFGTLFFFLFMKIDADKEIEKLAVTDYLTGMVNRRAYLEMGTRILDQCRQEGDILGVFFLDIDSFKMINDNYGHAKGDEVLVAFANMLHDKIRSKDICCRYGGDEFSICVRIPSIDIVTMIADRIQSGIAGIDIVPDRTITSSIGVAYGVPAASYTFETYIEQADKAMYTAKENGKNQVVYMHISETVL